MDSACSVGLGGAGGQTVARLKNLVETTRGSTERPAGKERVNEMPRLITAINDTIQRGGSFLIPVFALGRMQELFAILHDARKFGRLVDCPIYTGGLGVDLARFERALDRTPGLRERLFAESERDLPLRSLAGRFAAKEATSKALGIDLFHGQGGTRTR